MDETYYPSHVALSKLITALSDELDLLKIQEQSPLWNRSTDQVSLISTTEDLTASFADLGGEIYCRGYWNIFVYLTIDINDSLDVRLKVLGKHTSGGSEEYKYDHTLINCPATTVSAVAGKEESYIEFDNDQDDLYIIQIPVNNGIPFIQLQVEVGTVGTTAGQIDAAYIIKGY